MTTPNGFFANPNTLIILGLAWLAAWVAASAVFRLIRGKPVFTRPPPQPLFVERWRSGRSMNGFFSRLGGANRVLMVAISRDLLVIRPQFPFTLMFLPEIYGLEIEARLRDVVEARVEKTLFLSWVFVTVRDETGAVRRLKLQLRDPAGFLAALERAPQIS